MKSSVSRSAITFIISLLFLILILPVNGQESTGELTPDFYRLAWTLEPGTRYTYDLTKTGDALLQGWPRSEKFVLEVTDRTIFATGDSWYTIVAEGGSVEDSDPLGFRFQRALFPEFEYLIDTYGATTVDYPQTFPPFMNVPLFPNGSYPEGQTWSGGPVGILPTNNFGPMQFTFTSNLVEFVEYHGDLCALIETSYELVIDDETIGYKPFLGLYPGEDAGIAGSGAVVGDLVEGSRALEAGVLPGDLIVEAQGQRIRGWGGLLEISRFFVSDYPIEFKILRGDDEIIVKIAPEPVAAAWVGGSGGLESTVYFSLDKGFPLKIELQTVELKINFTDGAGLSTLERIDFNMDLEFLRSASLNY